MEISLYVPAARTAWLAGLLQSVAGDGAAVDIRKPLRVLELSRLRCLALSLEGSGEHVRCPLVPPILNVQAFAFARSKRAPHLLQGVDWLILSAAPELAGLLSEVVQAAPGSPRFTVTPFLALSGPLPQQPQEGDVAFPLSKSRTNHNQPGWQKNYRRLMNLPEERWNEVSSISNTTDLFHLYEPFLDRLLPEPPRLVLDLGCGLGQIARSLALRYPEARVVGLDASAEAIAVGEKTFRQPNLSLKVADFSKPLGFSPGSVDLIVSANALPYAVDQRATAAELMDMLRPDGLLLNYCRAEESHLIWDFPMSLLLPTNSQIFLSDWLHSARQHGRNTEVWSVPLGMTPAYFRASPMAYFSRLVKQHADQHLHDPAGPHQPWNSHVLLAHSTRATPADEAALPLADNHFARLEQVLATVPHAPAQYQDALIASWFYIAKGLELFPELLDFCLAVIPAAAPTLQAILQPALQQNRTQ